ncbi:hypothetical protein [Falsiroseomonas sp. CW058]|uniref:Pam3-gp28 family putative phage holin n=1 Tax=Falsiroseomonas sp. CW058 TaxID=3388664 RepID=UPI003D31DC2A
MNIDPVLSGQLRHVLSGVGGAVAGSAIAGESLEAAIGGIVLWLIGQAWSWWAKRA